jgi:hypothetical protein
MKKRHLEALGYRCVRACFRRYENTHTHIHTHTLTHTYRVVAIPYWEWDAREDTPVQRAQYLTYTHTHIHTYIHTYIQGGSNSVLGMGRM